MNENSLPAGINVETEVNYFFKVEPFSNCISLDNSADSFSHAKNLKSKSGIVRETRDTPHKTWGQDGNLVTLNRAGDGTVPWESLSYMATMSSELKMCKNQLQKESKFLEKSSSDPSSDGNKNGGSEEDFFIPDVQVAELEGVLHRDMLKDPNCISIVIDLACGLGIPNRHLTQW